MSLLPHTWPCLCLHIHLLNLLSIVPSLSPSSLCPLVSPPSLSPFLIFTSLPQFVCTGSRHCMRSRRSTAPERAQGLPPWTEGKLSIRTPHSSRGRASCWGERPLPDSGGGAIGKLDAPKHSRHNPLRKGTGALGRGGAITVQLRQQKQNWTLACENLLDELIWNQRIYINKRIYIYIWKRKHFQSGLDQHFMQKKRKSCDKQRNGGLSSHKYKYLSFPIYAVKNKL